LFFDENHCKLYTVTPDLAGKHLELLKEAISEISRVAVLTDSANPSNALWLGETKIALGALLITLQPLEVHNSHDLDAAFLAMKRERGALMVLRNTINVAHRGRRKAGYPQCIMHMDREFVDADGFMSYGPNHADLYRRAATYVDKILKGGKPADLPVEQPKKFEFIINLKTAKQIRLTIPQSVLYRADKIIK
jgi:ABC-type uncharacterized transport system substrate-binding protein